MRKIWVGIFWKILSCGCFAGVNVLVRFLSGGSPIPITTPLPIYSIMFFQNIIGVMLISICLWQFNGGLKTKIFVIRRPWLNAARILSAAIGIGLWYISLRYMPITQVVAISFIAPVITTMGAVLILKENFDWQRKVAVFFSIIGGFFMARPDQALLNNSDFNWYMLLPLLAALVFSFDKLLTRKLLTDHENPTNLALHLLIFICPLCMLPAIKYGWVTPELQQIPWLLLLGMLGALAHYTFNKAYALAEVTMLLPFGMAKIILSATISFLVFYEIPKTLDVWIGVGIITISSIILGINKNSWHKIRMGLTPAKQGA